MKLYNPLLSLLIFTTSCNGQNIEQPVIRSARIAASKYLKIPKSQDKYAAVSCGLADKIGNLWFGTSEGAYRYDGKYFTNFTEKDGLSGNTVRGIIQDKAGDIWFATTTGVSRYDGKTIINIPIASGNSLYFSGDASLNNNNPINAKNMPASILEDRNGKIWLGTSNGVFCYNGNYFTPFLDGTIINKNNLRLTMTVHMIEDRHGDIWFSTWFDGLCRYDGKALINYKPNGEVWFAGLKEDKSGNIWIGRRSKGVCRYDGKTFTNVLQGGVFDSCGIFNIVQDMAGNMWFCGEADDLTKRETTGGVWRYDGQHFTNYTTEDGLTDDGVFCAVIDKSGRLWFGTRNTGLCSYDGKMFTRLSE